jgi:Tol biopolymer transport system component
LPQPTVLAAAFLAWNGRRPHEAAGLAVQAAILPPPGVVFSSSTDNPLPIAVSPDGRTIAFCARTGEGPDMLWLRTIDSNDARVIAGTQNAEGPFFSPDARSVGFFAKGKLKRVDVTGGAVITLVERVDARGGSWNREGTILYGNSAYGPLWVVKDDGGTPTMATALDSTQEESTHRYPSFLPDGKHFLYLARRSGAGSGRNPTVYAGELGSATRTRVLEVASNVAYASGHLLYVREGVLVAQRFDLKTLAVSGSAVPLVDDARMDERFSRGVFSVSTNGVLVCMTGKNQTRTQLQWLDRKGTLLNDVGEPADYTYGGTPELSPDGRTAAMPIANRERGTSDVWLIDLASGRRRRLTVDSVDHPAATWHPNGKQVVVSSSEPGGSQFMMDVLSTDGAQLHRFTFHRRLFYWPRSVAPDGRTMLFDSPDGAILDQADIGLINMTTDSMTTLVTGGENVTSLPQFSPDGRRFAYESDESGRFEVYVAAYPTGGKWQVSQGGGAEPRWRNDGRELFYVDADNYVVALDVSQGTSFETGPSTRLFQFHGAGGQWRYDVSSDGQRFLVTGALPEELASPVTIMTDWTRKIETR